jgi:hypothetical protein
MCLTPLCAKRHIYKIIKLVPTFVWYNYTTMTITITPSFCGSLVVHFFSILCCVFCFVCLRAVSCVSNVASICGLSIIKYHLRFSLNFIATVLYILNTFHNLAFFIILFNINLCVVTKHFTKDSHLAGKHHMALYKYFLTC